MQGTPTVDPTITALEKKQLAEEIQQLEDQHQWAWTSVLTPFSTPFSILVALVVAISGLVRWRADRQAEREKQREAEKHLLEDRQVEREKQDEARFQSVVEGLGNSSPAMQAGAAIMLRTFLRPGYEQFYGQAFDLAVTNLRLRNVNPVVPEQLDSRSQALITVFKESFPLARDWLKQDPQVLDASYIQLDHAYLSHADLNVWREIERT